MLSLDRIDPNPAACAGKPVVRGARIMLPNIPGVFAEATRSTGFRQATRNSPPTTLPPRWNKRRGSLNGRGPSILG